MKKILAIVLTLVMLLSCAAFAEEVKPVILVVSFGTSYNDNRDLSIGAVEEAIQAAYPDWEVRRAFTAQTVIDILDERDAIDTDNVTEAMDKLVADGVKKVVIQPTHVMNGAEYDDVMAEIAPYADQFEGFAVGAPLLTSVEDYEAVTEALLAENEYAGSEDTAIVYMGHGTHHFANATYSQAQLVMQAAGYENAFVGTVEGFPALENVMANVTAYGATKVVLYPFMVVAGDHASNDMAGDEEDSWKTAFANAGFEVECVLEGLGQNAGVQAIYVEHVQAAMEETDCNCQSEVSEGCVSAQPSEDNTGENYETNHLAADAGFLHANRICGICPCRWIVHHRRILQLEDVQSHGLHSARGGRKNDRRAHHEWQRLRISLSGYVCGG